jgi:hypothetical protein
MRLGGWLVLWCLGFAGCEACGANAGLSASGARGYVRCLAAEPPAARVLERAGLRLELEGRELRITGAELPLRIAALAGAGFADPPPSGGGFDTLARSGARLVFVLGGMGDTSERAQKTARRLAQTKLPVVFVAGGRDSAVRIRSALAGLDGIVDATALDAVRIGSDTFLPLAGSSDGRYALDDGACGFGLADLKGRADRLGKPTPGERRWLLSWEAPAGPLTRAPVEVGNLDVAELATRVGASGGLHGWPDLQVGLPKGAAGPLVAEAAARDFGLVVPRLWGPWQERADGERSAPGFALVELSDSGLRVTLNENK